MEIYEQVNLQDCPLCGGAASLEEEDGHEFYVMCMECGCHTVDFTYKRPEDRLDAAKRVADLWNFGKVISHSPGE